MSDEELPLLTDELAEKVAPEIAKLRRYMADAPPGPTRDVSCKRCGAAGRLSVQKTHCMCGAPFLAVKP